MLIGCPDCGTAVDVPLLSPGMIATCPRCHHRLERTAGRSLQAGLACAVTTLLLLFPGNLLPLMTLTVAGAERQSRLGSGIVVLWQQGWFLIAIPIGVIGIVLPFVRFGLLAVVLAQLERGARVSWLGPAFRWATALDLWAMPDVFLVGCIIGYARIVAFIPVRIGAGGWCFVAAALMSMVTRAAIDRRSVWRRIAAPAEAPAGPTISCTSCDLLLPAAAAGTRCPRCRARLRVRKIDAAIRTGALVAAGYFLYLPANYYPMSINLQFGNANRHTIFSGIEDLVDAHLWPLAAIIFTASIAVPLLKLVGLTWFLLSTHRRSGKRLILRTRLHRLIDQLGRWSCIDVFTIVAFAPLLQFGRAVSVRAAPGAAAFLGVVLLTMLASRLYDPRLMWDAAEDET